MRFVLCRYNLNGEVLLLNNQLIIFVYLIYGLKCFTKFPKKYYKQDTPISKHFYPISTIALTQKGVFDLVFGFIKDTVETVP